MYPIHNRVKTGNYFKDKTRSFTKRFFKFYFKVNSYDLIDLTQKSTWKKYYFHYIDALEFKCKHFFFRIKEREVTLIITTKC